MGALTPRTSSRMVCVLLALLLAAGVGSARAAASPELTVSTVFVPPTARFGDRVVARLVVQADRDALDTNRLRIIEDVTPLAPLGQAHVSRAERGRVLVITYEVSTVCIVEACLATHGARSVRLPPARVDAPRRSGGVAQAQAAWPVLRLGGRVQAADLARSWPVFRRDVSAPAATYRVAPATLALALDVAAALLAAAAVVATAWHFGALVRRKRALDTRTELERVLAALRAAESAPVEQRRRAVGLLARLLVTRDPRLAGDAADLAWSEPKPTSEELVELADRVVREVG
jgi:hypothetical protein